MTNTLMTLLFPFLDFIPFGLPRYWLHRERLRIPFRYVVVMFLVISSVNSAAFYYINLGGYETAAKYTTLMRYGFMLLNLFLSFALIRETFSRNMFSYLLLLSWSFFVFGNANFIESRFFWDFSDRHPYLVYNVCRIILLMATYPFMLHFLNNTVTAALRIRDDGIWRYMWKIPLFSTLFGLLYCTVTDVYAFASWQFLVSRYLMLFGTCYVSYVVLKVLEISDQRTVLESALKYADRSLMAQKKQFDSLAAHMEEMKKARHDLRQHLAVVQSYISRDDRDGLREYIEIYKTELPPDITEVYCRNQVINALVCYYAALARKDRIQFDAQVSYPDNCPVSDTEATVILGNMLENAVEACQRESGTRKIIRLRIRQRKESSLLFLTDNTCTVPVRFTEDMKVPLSSKRKGAGIGIMSIREIADRYDGNVRFEQKEGMFYASVSLQFPYEDSSISGCHSWE